MSERVKILVEIIDHFSDELDKLDRKLKELDKHRRKTVQINVDGFAQVAAMNEALNHAARSRVSRVTQIPGGLVPFDNLPAVPGGSNTPGFDGFEDWFSWMAEPYQKRLARAQGSLNGVLSRSNGILRRMIPTYQMWISALAAILPLIIVLGVSAFGLAAAFGAVAVAGAGLLGLGLIGEGDSMASAFENARQSVQEFKQELFEVFQPTAQLFSPIAQMFMGTAPARLGGLIEGVESLRVFEDLINDSFDGVVSWVNEALVTMSEFRGEIEHISDVLGPAVGSAFINFLRFVTQEASANSGLIIRLGMAFALIMKVIYDLSLVLSAVVVSFLPLLAVLRMITDVLNNKYIVGVLTAIIAMWGVIFVLRTLVGGIQSAIAAFIFYGRILDMITTKATLASLAMGALVGLLTLGVGLFAAMGAMKAFEANMNQNFSAVGTPVSASSVGLADRGVSQVTYNTVVNTQSNVSASDIEYAVSEFNSRKERAEKP